MKTKNNLAIPTIIAVTVAVSILVALSATASAATTWYVDDDCEAAPDGTAGNPYCTIQAAITAASPGDTINVAAGTYVEQIIIDKSITLQGEDRDTTIIEYPPVTLSDQYLVSVNADDVTIKGFKLLGHFATGNRAVYIIHSKKTGLIVENNEIQGHIGVFGALINAQIKNNIIGTDRKGIYIPGGNNLLIEGNTIEPAEGAGSYASNCGAIYMDHAIDITIQGNTMRDFSSSTDSSMTAGRGIEGSHNSYITISGNTFENSRDAITMWIVTDIEIDGNTIANSDRYGINIKGQNINIINNEITGSGDSGVNIAEFDISTQNVNVNFNNIVGNTNYGIKNGWSGEVNAENNWWGHASGPSGAGTGTGDAVSDNVDFEPWSFTPDPCEPKTIGFWKTHGDSVDAVLDDYGQISLGGYTVVDPQAVFNNAKNKNANTMLAAQLLAAELNVLHLVHVGIEYCPCVNGVIIDADAFLSGHEYNGPDYPGDPPRGEAKDDINEIKDDLDEYNQGLCIC